MPKYYDYQKASGYSPPQRMPPSPVAKRGGSGTDHQAFDAGGFQGDGRKDSRDRDQSERDTNKNYREYKAVLRSVGLAYSWHARNSVRGE